MATMTRASLIIFYKDKETGRFQLDPSCVSSLGRSSHNDIHLGAGSASKTDTSVSRFHAAIIPTEDGNYLLQDLGSLNGTVVGSSRAGYAYLVNNDRIRIGDYTVVFQEDAGRTAGPAEPSPLLREVPSLGVKTRLAPVVFPEESALKKIESETQSVSLLYRLVRTVAVQSDFELACRMAVAELTKALGFERGCAVLVDGSTSVSRCLATVPARTTVEVSPSLIDEMVKTGKPVIIEDSSDGEDGRKGPVVRDIAIPLSVDGRMCAVIYLTSPMRAALLEEERALIGLLSRDLSAILHQQQVNRDLQIEKQALESRLASKRMIVGISSKVKKTLQDISVYGRTDVPVLVLGETGTGKELIAHALHRASSRREQPFLELNCAAIPETILESELFGVIPDYPGFHSKEGLTGKIRLANGGTLFLDEIGDMSAALQAKLLRFIDEQVIWPLGSTQPVKVDVRIVAATNRDLRARIKTGSFREDLYQRLSVVELSFPPLAERREDIPLLSGFFLAKLREKYGNISRLSYESVEFLSSCDWPGNVRELKNCIERAAIRAVAEGSSEITSSLLQSRAENSDLKTLEDIAREHITRVLRHTDGNKEKAYKILGISRATLFNKINEYGLREFQEE